MERGQGGWGGEPGERMTLALFPVPSWLWDSYAEMVITKPRAVGWGADALARGLSRCGIVALFCLA